MVRIAAALCGLVFGALFIWVAVETFVHDDPIVVPTNGVMAGAAADPLPTSPKARDALAERTRLQGWRAESGPSPGGRATADQAVGGMEMPPSGTGFSTEGAQLTQEWLAARDADWPILIDRGYLAGTASLPLARDSVLMQPQGRDFRRLHETGISYTGGWIIFGMSLALSLFLLVRGRIRIAKGFSGDTIVRFSGFERANHWLTAGGFIVLGLTGLLIIYGWSLLAPLIGPDAYSVVAEISLYLHIAAAAPFTLGILVMAVVWLRQNLPTRLDMHWLARFGGFLNDSPDNPPARRFNAGQKLVFWGVILGGALLFVSGVTLMFPFFWTDVQMLQWTLLAHGLLALFMVALILGHIYIGTVGMEGAFDAMWSGQVDRNWAEEHHSLWVEEIDRERGRSGRSPAPAE